MTNKHMKRYTRSLALLGKCKLNHKEIPLETHCLCAESLSRVNLFATPWTLACQGPLSMGILQTGILEWVAMPSSRGSSQPRDPTQVSCIAGRFFTV